jgi:tetratricopeptide (TPR) repeat protein
LSEALKLSPQMTEAAVALAGIDNKRGDYDDALRLAGSALKTNPNLSLAYAASAQAQLAKGDLRQGEALLQEALKRDPTNLPALALMLALRAKQGRTTESVQDLSILVAQHPSEAGLHLLLAVGYLNLKDLDKSEASARQALALDPKIPNAYTLLANIDFARGETAKGKADFRAAIELNPHNLSNYAGLGSQFEKEGNWDEAKKLFEKAHGVEPDSPFVADELAFLYLEHGGDVNVALNLAQTAKQKLPNSPIAADALGWAYYKIGSAESAVEQLKDCVREVPKNPVFQYHLGMAYVAAGRLDAARGSLQKALADDPNFAYAANTRETLTKLSRGNQ